MRVSDDQLKTVAFLCADAERADGTKARVPGGTAFFVLINDDNIWVAYTVTASHNLASIGNRPFYLRVNADDHYDDLETRLDEWFSHDSADVALTRFTGMGYNLGCFTLDEFVGADYRFRSSAPGLSITDIKTGSSPSDEGIPVETGNDIFYLGLFSQHYGQRKNLPIARFGHIARMPSEPVTLEWPDGSHRDVIAYLVEGQSWGGHSGSPVYWRHPIAQLAIVDAPQGVPSAHTVNGKICIQRPDNDLVAFLGLVSGHFYIPQAARTQGDFLGSISMDLNSGIAIVTPAEAIRELLTREDVVEDRKDAVARARREGGPTVSLDSNIHQGEEFDKFRDLTQTLLQVPKDEADEAHRGHQGGG